MKLRAITLFTDPPLDESAAAAAAAVRSAFTAAGHEVQFARLASPPFPAYARTAAEALGMARDAAAAAQAHAIDYVSLGPAWGDWIDFVPDLLAASQSIFCGIRIADQDRGVDLEAVRRAATVVREVSTLSPDGFANLRLAALANVPSGSPFFPAAYHAGGDRAFAVAVEAADLAVSACASASTATEARDALTASIERHAAGIARVARQAARALGVRFGGIDFSLAPFPRPERSIGAAIEILSGAPVGAAGTLAAAALLTEAIDRARFPRCGFCGLMLPVLEDSLLARRAAEGRLRLNDLLLMSAVCGVGLDTIPLPGDVSQTALAAILADVAAQSLRLDKPLTARLMPMPGKRAGDAIAFDFPYFADSAVMAVDEDLAAGLIGASAQVEVFARGRAARR